METDIKIMTVKDLKLSTFFKFDEVNRVEGPACPICCDCCLCETGGH